MASIKLFHLLCLFVWIGSLLTLTRLLGYVAKEEGAVKEKILKIMRRMYLLVDVPAMCLSITSGWVLFVLKKMDFSHGWLHMKLTMAFFLICCDVIAGRAILKKRESRRGVRYKVLHGVTALMLIGLLTAVYIVKNKVTVESSLAKNEPQGYDSPLENKE